MPYQVKSTPFFKRLVMISKSNGQLQRLKEEYERTMGVQTSGDDLKTCLRKFFEEREKNKKASEELEKKESPEKSPPNTTQGTDQTSFTDTELAEEDTIEEDAMAPTTSRKAYRLNHGSDAPGSSKCAEQQKQL